MTPFALLLLLAASSVELVDEVYQIPPGEWKYVEVNLRQRPARVIAGFGVDNTPGKVRLALMTRADLERLRELNHGLLAGADFGRSAGSISGSASGTFWWWTTVPARRRLPPSTCTLR
jgi:hypothetical protein